LYFSCNLQVGSGELQGRSLLAFGGDCHNLMARMILEIASIRGHISCLQNGHGRRAMVTGFILLGTRDLARSFRVRVRLRTGLSGGPMLVFTALVTLFLFIYLLVALLRPEWF
jgi:K+-transporting ATPase KdpF subunit